MPNWSVARRIHPIVPRRTLKTAKALWGFWVTITRRRGEARILNRLCELLEALEKKRSIWSTALELRSCLLSEKLMQLNFRLAWRPCSSFRAPLICLFIAVKPAKFNQASGGRDGGGIEIPPALDSGRQSCQSRMSHNASPVLASLSLFLRQLDLTLGWGRDRSLS